MLIFSVRHQLPTSFGKSKRSKGKEEVDFARKDASGELVFEWGKL